VRRTSSSSLQIFLQKPVTTLLDCPSLKFTSFRLFVHVLFVMSKKLLLYYTTFYHKLLVLSEFILSRKIRTFYHHHEVTINFKRRDFCSKLSTHSLSEDNSDQHHTLTHNFFVFVLNFKFLHSKILYFFLFFAFWTFSDNYTHMNYKKLVFNCQVIFKLILFVEICWFLTPNFFFFFLFWIWTLTSQ